MTEGHHAKGNKPVTKGQMLHDSSYTKILKFIETEHRVLVPGAWVLSHWV